MLLEWRLLLLLQFLGLDCRWWQLSRELLWLLLLLLLLLLAYTAPFPATVVLCPYCPSTTRGLTTVDPQLSLSATLSTRVSRHIALPVGCVSALGTSFKYTVGSLGRTGDN